MKDFFVVWQYRDRMDECLTLYRAILRGANETVVLVQASSLAPQVIHYHNNSDRFATKDDLTVGDIEVTVRPIDDWIAELRKSGEDLPNINPFEGEDAEDDEA